MPQPSWSPSTTQQLRKLVAAPYLAPNDWTPRSEAYFVFPLAQGTPGKQCGLAATGVYQPSLRSPWLAAAAVYSYPSVDSSVSRETESPIPVAVSRCRPRLFLMPVFGAILAQVFGEIPLKTSRSPSCFPLDNTSFINYTISPVSATGSGNPVMKELQDRGGDATFWPIFNNSSD
ncbi:hypothetical protein [Thiolapillus sp.]|uniref:hypothetical protein n=6 Tax=Thiolapillus sp. TaxID=2017437 RepID=UPI003AF73926